MTYKDYSDIDFIKDEFFVRWVKRPDTETDHYWKSWLANNPEKRKEVEIARKFLEQLSIEDEYLLPEKEFIQLHENILRFNREQRYKQTDYLFKSYRSYGKAWTAVIAFLIISLGVILFINRGTSENEGRMAFITKTSSKGIKSTVKLPDGTLVKLNANSKIRFPETFLSDREVFLEGEAFFKVIKDTTKPFKVYSSGLTTTVLGTSFNIRSYDNEDKTKIALLEGKVKIDSDLLSTSSVLLHPSEMMVFEKRNESFSKEKFNYLEEFGWKDGVLYFSDKSLKEVFFTLEQWYGVEIQVSDNISMSDLFEAEFRNETLENVLTSISYSSNFDFKIQGNKVKIFN